MFDWYEDGLAIPDVYARSDDADVILDADDDALACGVSDWAALNWRECTVPIAAFGLIYTSLDEHIAQLRGCTRAYELERLSDIIAWVDSVGGIEAALRISPLLITIRGDQVKIEDGYHRLGVAMHHYGVPTVNALCGVVDLPAPGSAGMYESGP